MVPSEPIVVPFERTQNFIAESLAPTSQFRKGSIRTRVLPGGHRLRFGIPKDKEWGASRAVQLLHPFPDTRMTRQEHGKIVVTLLKRYRIKRLPEGVKSHPFWGAYVQATRATLQRKKTGVTRNPVSASWEEYVPGHWARGMRNGAVHVEFSETAVILGLPPYHWDVFSQENRVGEGASESLERAKSSAERVHREYHGVAMPKKKQARRVNPIPPTPTTIDRAHREFHGRNPDRTTKFDYDPSTLEHLWILGHGKFIAYEPNSKSSKAGSIYVHHFGDHGTSGSDHWTCSECGMIHYSKKVPTGKLPLVGVSGDGKVVVVIGSQMKVGARGI